MTDQPTIEEFSATAEAWLDANRDRRNTEARQEIEWGEGEFSVAVFHDLTESEEAALLEDLRGYNQAKAEHGYHAISWPTEYGGLDLPRSYARAFARLESQYELPQGHETFGVTTGLIAPTVNLFGTDEQKQRFLPPLLRTDYWAVQLFSEPGAGSDLGALACRAERDGDEWVINGQKVWSSGAVHAAWGELIARTDPDVPKHAGQTAFMVPMDAEGVEIRPIRQMSGGASFNEVFFTDVRVPDDLRLGDVGQGWKVALTTLSFERDHSSGGGSGGSRVGGSWRQLLATARAMGVTDDPIVRDALVDVYLHAQVERYTLRRAADLARGGQPGPEGSIGKLLWTDGMRRMSDAISLVLGPRLVADSGEWGTYAWGEHVLGAPGYRIAGGSDEVQRNIVGERVLGLPGEPRVDKGVPFKDIPR